MNRKDFFYEHLEKSKETSILIKKLFEKEKMSWAQAVASLTYLLIEKWDNPADFLCIDIMAASECMKLEKIKETYKNLK